MYLLIVIGQSRDPGQTEMSSQIPKYWGIPLGPRTSLDREAVCSLVRDSELPLIAGKIGFCEHFKTALALASKVS